MADETNWSIPNDLQRCMVIVQVHFRFDWRKRVDDRKNGGEDELYIWGLAKALGLARSESRYEYP